MYLNKIINGEGALLSFVVLFLKRKKKVCLHAGSIYRPSVYKTDDPPMLEALACREALALAQDLNLDQIVVACDCKTVVEEIKSGTEGRYSIVIKEIQAQARQFSRCDFIFEGRQGNVDAHNLVKFCTSLEQGRHMWLGVPHDPFVIPVNRNTNQ